METLQIQPGVMVNLYGHGRDIGYGSELIDGQYVWTGEVDTWGKYTFRDTNGGETVYLFLDEIDEATPVYPS